MRCGERLSRGSDGERRYTATKRPSNFVLQRSSHPPRILELIRPLSGTKLESEMDMGGRAGRNGSHGKFDEPSTEAAAGVAKRRCDHSYPNPEETLEIIRE
jgi:hypothetical protein